MITVHLVTEIKPYTTKELAAIYGVCDKTLKKWMKPFAVEIGEKQGRYYTVAQVKTIFEKIGVPCKFTE
jgi:transposase-like protein